MSYMALYRKYRPDNFEGIVGQENITKILRNQVRTGKISHAYIFSGTRGTGKTSSAKVFSRAINCLSPQDGNPCNECKICKGILDGSITDVIEMDAASNNSVDNIRQIRQEVVYATIDVKYRVYIIDEVHMLTTSAFNALLKTLEEPPENVVFILATTEQHKIPVTILSRCLRFEFGRISDEYIEKRLEYILDEEKVVYDKEAIEYIAKLAEGGLRDAISILERCITESKDILKYKDVLQIVGAADKEIIKEIAQNILDCNVETAIENVDKVVKKGKDLRQFVSQITEEILSRLIETKIQADKTNLIRIIDRLSKLDNDLRLTSNPVIVLKSCIIELCNLEFETKSSNGMGVSSSEIDMLRQKISKLEQEISSINSNLNTSTPIKNIKSDFQKLIPKEIKNVKNEDVEISNMQPFENVDGFKKDVIESGKLKIYSALAGANIYISSEYVCIITSNSFAYNILRMQESIDVIKQIFSEKYSINMDIVVKLNNSSEEVKPKIEKIFKDNDIEYKEID